ncbi:MAG: hypothetical protein AAF687_01520 [Pseudomonadota bacterium]
MTFRAHLSRFMFGAFLLLGALALAPQPAFAQDSEGVAKEIVKQTGNAVKIAKQIKGQGGRLTGRTGAKIAGASGSIVTILTNFDTLTCNTSVMALYIKMRDLSIAAALANDPALDAQVSQLRAIIAKLQALCNKYVNKVPTGVATGGSSGSDTGSGDDADEEDSDTSAAPPTSGYSVEERICLRKCGKLHSAYLDAKKEFEREKKYADSKRADATAKRKAANAADAVAKKAEQDAIDAQKKGAQLRRQLTSAKTQEKRLELADEIADLREGSKQRWADAKRAEADKAEAEAKAAEAAADAAEAQAAQAYEVMNTLYEAWLKCAKTCADKAKKYSNQVIDPFTLFWGTRDKPDAPAYYTPPVTVPEEEPAKRVSRVILPPAAISGGSLRGVVIDEQDEPQEEARVAFEFPADDYRVTGGLEIDPEDPPEWIAYPGNETATGSRPLVFVPGILGSSLTAKPAERADSDEFRPITIPIVDAAPEDLPFVPGDYVDLANPVSLGVPYEGANISQAGDPLPGEMPVAVAFGPDGIEGTTNLVVPKWVQPGPLEFELYTPEGDVIEVKSEGYQFVRGWIEQDKLRSGQVAQFGFDLQFGDGPGTVTMVIATAGPIVYERVGQPQVLQISEDGKVSFTDTVQALKGSPVGIPFAITPTFTRGE